MQAKKTYLFKNLRVKRNNNTQELCVNTAKEGFSVEMTDDFEEELAEPEPTVLEMTTKEIQITIIGIKGTSNYYICSSCGKKAVLVGSLLNCESCKMKQRVMSDNKQWCGRLFVQNTNTKEHLNIMVFHQHQHKYSSAMATSWSGDKITCVLLEGDNIHLTYDINNNKCVDVNF